MRRRWTLNNIYAAYPDLFEELQLPAGVCKATFVATVLDEYGELTVAKLIPRFKTSVTLWGQRNAYALSRLLGTTTAEYNPIENFDRKEDVTDTRDNSVVTKGTSGNTTKSNGAGNTNSRSKESAYERGTLVDTSEVTNTSNQTDTVEAVGKVTSDTSGLETYTHTSHMHGNIGVTSNQQMLEAERKLVNYDFYLAAANMFANDMLICVYNF